MIAFCDPGLADAAIIAYDETTFTITAVETFTTPANGSTPRFEDVIERARLQASRIVRFTLNHGCTRLVCESYQDIPGPQRGAKHRWTTPMVCMAIADRIQPFTEPGVAHVILEWQSPKDVMTRYRAHKETWKAKRFGIVTGDKLLTNDHLRSAGAHLLAWEEIR